MSQYSFDNKRFQPLLEAYLSSNCNFNDLPPGIKKQGMRVYIHDNIPSIWLGDGYHFMEAHFTKEAINEFRKNHNTMKFSYLKDKMLILQRWHLRTSYEDSTRQYTSFQNLSVQIVVESFRPLPYERPTSKQVREATCVFQIPEIQCLIKSLRHQVLQKQVLQKHFYHAELAMPSAKDIFKSESSHLLRQLPDNNVLMLDESDSDEIARESERKDIIEANKQTLATITQRLTETEVLRCQEADRDEDFREIRELAFTQESVDTAASESRYYDVRRLIVQEKGEEDYEYINKRKLELLQEAINDEITRNELTMNLEHYQSKQKSRQEFQRQLEIQYKLREQKQAQKKHRRVIQYRLGYTSKTIKEKLLKFMASFNSEMPNQENTIELRDEEETRPRAYSQDNHRHDHSELIEVRTVSNFEGGGYALSQYVCQQSVFNGDLTESEDEEDFDPSAVNKRQVREAISQVQPTMPLFKRYLEWFQQNEVTSQSSYQALMAYIQREAAERAAREEADRLERERQEEKERLEAQRREEAERYRLEQEELERQRKAQYKEKRRLQKIEEQEAEQRRREEEALAIQAQQRQSEAEAEARLEAQRRHQEEQERKARQEERLREEALAREEQRLKDEAKQREDEARAKEEARKREIEQLEKERLEQLERDKLRREQEERAWQEQERRRIMQEKEQLAELKRREERKRREEAEQEVKAQKLRAEKEKLKMEIELQKQKDEEKRVQRERKAAEQRAQLEEEKRRKFEAEKEQLKQQILKQKEEMRLIQEERERELKRQQQLEESRLLELKSKQVAMVIVSQKQEAEEEIEHDLDEKSSISSGQNERTPDFQNEPSAHIEAPSDVEAMSDRELLSDRDLQNHQSVNFLNSQNSSQPNVHTESPEFASNHILLRQAKLAEPESEVEDEEEEKSTNLGKRAHSGSHKKKKRRSPSPSPSSDSDSSAAKDDDSDSDVDSSGKSSSSSSGDDDDSANSEDSYDRKIRQSKYRLVVKEIEGLEELLRIQKKKDKKEDRVSKTTKKLKKQLCDALKRQEKLVAPDTASTVYSSSKKSSKKSSSRREDKSSDKKKKKHRKERVTSAFNIGQETEYVPKVAKASAEPTSFDNWMKTQQPAPTVSPKKLIEDLRRHEDSKRKLKQY